MSIPGVDAIVALSIVAAVGDVTRFRTPDKLVCYLGLNPRVRQSGGHPASHAGITKAGPGHARGMLVEAAWAASRTPGPLRAFYQRVRARHGMQIAIVATAGKLAVLCWHLLIKGESDAFAQPSLLARKHRTLELRAGLPPGERSQRHRRRLLPESRPRRRARTGRSKRARLPHDGRCLAAGQTPQHDCHRQESGGGRAGQQRDATSTARRPSSATGLAVPTPRSSLGGQPRPPQPDATAVLAAVKVVRPTGRSTLTAAAGRRSQAATPGKEIGPDQAHEAAPPLTLSSVAYCSVTCRAAGASSSTRRG
jgi:hypothetical protein